MAVKTTKWMTVLALAVLWLSTEAAVAAFGTWSYHNLRGYRNSWNFSYTGRIADGIILYVPTGCEALWIETGTDGHSGYGNSDLYVRYGALPTRATYTRRSIRYNRQDRIYLGTPSAGRYYVRLYGRSNYRTCLKVTIMSSRTWNNGGCEKFSLERCNWERSIRGVAKLSLSSRLNTAAQRHTLDMYNHGFLSHTGSSATPRTLAQRIAATGYLASSSRENIGTEYTVEDQFSIWMNNAASRANILNSSLRQAGFGSWYNDNEWGRSVAVFARPR
jgi:uncharacterized protein YkwD